MINKNTKIFLAGHQGMVGSEIFSKLKLLGYKKIIVASKKDLNLINQTSVYNFLKKTRPEVVIIAAAKVGGIYANNFYRAEFIYENLLIQNNLIHGSFLNKINHLVFLGSSCAYPKNSKQPIKEKYLLTSELEKTNEPYAIAKIAGIKMCENYNFQYKTNYISLMPSNSYGPNDNYDSKNSHFFASLIKKIHIAKINNKKSIKLWGNGKAQRELIYVGDIADACIYFMGKKIKDSLINIGTGKCFTIYQYAKFIMKQLNVRMEIELDKTMPNGTPKKLLDISLAKKYGWSAKIDLKTGFNLTYRSFLKENFISKK
jgi:GDP-L-fucose synthase